MHHRKVLRTAGSITARYHVGDTPMDLQAADGAGAQGIGVTTGIYSREELAASSPGAAGLMLMIFSSGRQLCALTGLSLSLGVTDASGTPRCHLLLCALQSRSSCQT